MICCRSLVITVKHFVKWNLKLDMPGGHPYFSGNLYKNKP